MRSDSPAIPLVGGPFDRCFAENTGALKTGVAIPVKGTAYYACYSWGLDDESYRFDGTVKDPALLPDPAPADRRRKAPKTPVKQRQWVGRRHKSPTSGTASR